MLWETGTISIKMQILQTLALFGPRIGGRTEKAVLCESFYIPSPSRGAAAVLRPKLVTQGNEISGKACQSDITRGW